MKEFYTRSTANEGIEMPLFLPSGKKTKYWMKILGADSDTNHETHARLMSRQAPKIKIEAENIDDPKEREKFITEKQRDLEREAIAMLIVDWNLERDDKPVECTQEEKVNFLREAPQIADQINRVASDRNVFFLKGQTSSSSTQEQKSN